MSKRSINGEEPVSKRPSIAPKSTNKLGEDGISECFHKVTTRMYVSLAPMHLKNPINGIKAQHLDPLIMNYFPKAKGVVLAYSNIKLSSDNISIDSEDQPISIARIEGSSPFTFLWVTLDLLIWRPQVGDELEGYIYMQTASHLGLLVHDTFNASIKKYNIPSGWSFIPNQEDEVQEETTTPKFKSFGYWVDENEVKIEGKLKFTIKAIHSAGRVVSVEGTLIKPGAEKDAQPVFRERRSSASNGPSGSPKGKHMKFDEEPIETVTEIPEPTDENELPGYAKDSDDEDLVNNSDSDGDSD
ncbi:uncharacterized protein CANTADRAFT_24819 [Suhomyces tanzawaensis NRRL Y-17324]|uniref:DNA-directed RNA polymerase subunit n=1 Tax=Suhomyces tanzawaensis NRRL Y-17324 TaxID=984487 RepID=A0A1E4SRR1_9ASCO|nr:uncharacterized protein CANTADRAFT_24819 [Suhomyces tanzawaensis NRRL Y-17324]ODV82199.1 hypothetical protein CANTADRAFT_24819 [Suhomyces tanzawaensis NRRL Y-17324]